MTKKSTFSERFKIFFHSSERSVAHPLPPLYFHNRCNSLIYNFSGVLTGLKEIIKRESFFALYKGNSAQMVRIFPYAAVQFTSFEIYKNVRHFYLRTNSKFVTYRILISENFQLFSQALGSKSHLGKFASGSMAGVTAVTLTYPLDTIRVRLAFQVTGQHVYSGIVHTAVSIVKQVRDFLYA